MRHRHGGRGRRGGYAGHGGYGGQGGGGDAVLPGRAVPELVAEVEIRPMTGDDLGEVLAIERASFAVPWTPATFHGLLDRDDAHLHVALVDGRVVGYTAIWVVLDQAELGDIAVDGAWRGRGIGRRLLEHAHALVRQRGVKELYLEVRESNHGARRLYERHGFVEVGRRRGYYSRPIEDALVLRRLIAD